jgi:hypothetical protein
MHKLILAAAVALILSGSLAWKAEATPGPNMGMLPATEFSPVIKAGCGGPGRCPWGRYWVCRPRGCWCAPCGGYYRPYVYRRPYDLSPPLLAPLVAARMQGRSAAQIRFCSSAASIDVGVRRLKQTPR